MNDSRKCHTRDKSARTTAFVLTSYSKRWENLRSLERIWVRGSRCFDYLFTIQKSYFQCPSSISGASISFGALSDYVLLRSLCFEFSVLHQHHRQRKKQKEKYNSWSSDLSRIAGVLIIFYFYCPTGSSLQEGSIERQCNFFTHDYIILNNVHWSIYVRHTHRSNRMTHAPFSTCETVGATSRDVMCAWYRSTTEQQRDQIFENTHKHT